MTLKSILRRQYRGRPIFESILGEDDLTRLKQLPDADRGQLGLIISTLPYGIHDLLPRPVRYFTVLRHPVKRAISYYYSVKRTPGHRLYDAIHQENLDVNAFIRSRSRNIRELNNLQTRMLSGLGAGWGKDQVDESDLDLAITHLRQDFHAIGLTERFDESILLMQARLGWGLPLYESQNVTAYHQARDTVHPETIEMIKAHNALDMRLYQAAESLFDEQLAAHVPDAARRAATFERYNAWYGRAKRAARTIRAMIRR